MNFCFSLLSSAPSNDVFDQAKSSDQMSQFSLDLIPETVDDSPPQYLPEPCDKCDNGSQNVADVAFVASADPLPDIAEQEDNMSAKLDVVLEQISSEEVPVTKLSMRECLDESTLEPQFKITSIADLIRIRKEERQQEEQAREQEKGKYC